MEEFTPENLIEHINRLERSLTRVWWGLSLLGIVGAALVGVTVVLVNRHSPSSSLGTLSPVAGRVTAREFIVTDEDGKAVAWFGTLKNGFSGLILTAPTGTTRDETEDLPKHIVDLFAEIATRGGSYLTARSDETELSLADGSGDQKKADNVSLSVRSSSSGAHESALRLSGRDGMVTFSGIEKGASTEKESASLSLFGSKDNGSTSQGASLELDADGSSYLEFGEGVLNPRARLEIDAKGLPWLKLFDKDRETRAQFTLSSNGDPELSLWGKGEKIYGGTSLKEDGLTLWDEHGKARATLGTTSLENTHTGSTETTAPGSLTLFDKNGRVIWQVPR